MVLFNSRFWLAFAGAVILLLIGLALLEITGG